MFGDFFISAMFPRFCVHCSEEGKLLCSACCVNWQMQPRSKGYKHLASGSYANAISRSMMRIWKYHFDKTALSFLRAKILDQERLIRSFACMYRIEAIVPVPLHYQRQAERGFNQAAVIAGLISEIAEIPVIHGLKRIYPTSQSARREKGRRGFNENPFRRRCELPSRILLIDDVWTTGETLKHCANAVDSECFFYTVLVNI